MNIALATSQNFPNGYHDTEQLLNECKSKDHNASLQVWDSYSVDWSSFDIVFLHTPWDYTQKYQQFLQWCEVVSKQSHLINPYSVVRWNTSKTYLFDLQKAGITIPATKLYPKESLNFDYTSDFLTAVKCGVVVKPVIDVGGKNAHRFDSLDEALNADVTEELHKRFDLLVQAYDPRVKTEGEYSVIYIGGKPSHCILKKPAAGEFRVQDIHGGSVESVELTDTIASFGQSILRSIAGKPAYARIDFIGAENPSLIELELIEPELFLRFSTHAYRLLVDALVNHLRTNTK